MELKSITFIEKVFIDQSEGFNTFEVGKDGVRLIRVTSLGDIVISFLKRNDMFFHGVKYYGYI